MRFIQGFANVGRYAASALVELGMKVIAVSDVRGGVVDRGVLDIEQLVSQVENTGSVVEAKGTESIENAALLELECDFLIPAALGGVITARERTEDWSQSGRGGCIIVTRSVVAAIRMSEPEYKHGLWPHRRNLDHSLVESNDFGLVVVQERP